jgi:hypothetical protein
MAGLQVTTLVLLFVTTPPQTPIHKPSAGFSLQSGVKKVFPISKEIKAAIIFYA